MDKADNFFKTEMLKIERNSFIFRIFTIVAGYAGITFWLNSIRASASSWFVWVLIVIQLLLYFSIFSSGYARASVIGLNKKFGFILFLALAVLGRVNNWELLIIPSFVVIMLIFSAKNNNVSDKGKMCLPKK